MAACDDALALCLLNELPDCWEQWDQCVGNAYSAHDECISNALAEYNSDVDSCHFLWDDQIETHEKRIAELKARLEQLTRKRDLEWRLRDRAWNKLVEAYNECFDQAVQEGEALTTHSAISDERCIITVSKSTRTLDIDP